VTAANPPAGALILEMTGPPPRYRPTALVATAGDVVFFLRNTSPSQDARAIHTLAIGFSLREPKVVSPEIAGGESVVFTVHGLAAGEYRIWCTFPAHAGLGQMGTLTVQ